MNNQESSTSPSFQTFLCSNNSLIEVKCSNARNRLSKLHDKFYREESSITKLDLKEFVGYQLGLKVNIKPSLKAHLTNKNRIVKEVRRVQAFAQDNVTTAPLQGSNNNNNNHQTPRVPLQGSQLYKMKIGYILNH